MALKVPGEEFTVFASAHRDRAPMCLVHTTGGSGEGSSRIRHHRTTDKSTMEVTNIDLLLQQPEVHSIYCSCFWAVDRFNSLAFGKGAFHLTVQTRRWQMRLLYGLISATVINSFAAHALVAKQAGEEGCELLDFKKELAE